jgi:ABC-2 type transport system ATP-binding protein
MTLGIETTPAIEVRDLVKRYPKRPVNGVDGVSFAVPEGETFGLLGPNGAGKTTTIGILTTRVRLTSGYAAIVGIEVSRNPVAAKRRFAVVPQRNNLDRSLTARQNLLFHAAYFGMPRQERERRADTLLEQFGLGDRGGDKVDFYSGGMAQRLMIVRALMHEPDVLFLDEPTTGLDPQARLFVWDRIRELNGRGLTILLTTHDMDEADTLCGRVAVMDHGKILALDTPQVLKRLVPSGQTLELHIAAGTQSNGLDPVLHDLSALPGVEHVEQVPLHDAEVASGRPSASRGDAPDLDDRHPVIKVYGAGAAGLIAPATQVVARHGAQLRDLHVSMASLEDVFIHLTGRALR